ncbi:MAG: hypothetical protein FGM37_05620 [Phycisphaerales bacterium]|nr:hypothetical protein [Phycisphaerales bacterium]
MNTTPAAPPEPMARVPWKSTLIAGVVAAGLSCAGWWAGCRLLAPTVELSPDTVRIGCSGIILTWVVAALSMLALTPWTARPFSTLAALWMGSTIIRLLVTPAGAYLLYLSSPSAPKALALAVGLGYFVQLMTEASSIAAGLAKALVPTK